MTGQAFGQPQAPPKPIDVTKADKKKNKKGR
jgi:hypothetical protein